MPKQLCLSENTESLLQQKGSRGVRSDSAGAPEPRSAGGKLPLCAAPWAPRCGSAAWRLQAVLPLGPLGPLSFPSQCVYLYRERGRSPLCARRGEPGRRTYSVSLAYFHRFLWSVYRRQRRIDRLTARGVASASARAERIPLPVRVRPGALPGAGPRGRRPRVQTPKGRACRVTAMSSIRNLNASMCIRFLRSSSISVVPDLRLALTCRSRAPQQRRSSAAAAPQQRRKDPARTPQ